MSISGEEKNGSRFSCTMENNASIKENEGDTYSLEYIPRA